MLDDCKEYRCENGEWQATGATNDQCCYYYNYYYYNDYFYNWDSWHDYYYLYYTGLNVTVPGPGCTEKVCVSSNQWETRQLNISDCCEENSHYFINGQIEFKDDCYAYVCEDGVLKKTNTTHPRCCTTYDYEISEAEQLYKKYWQRFTWWYYEQNWYPYYVDYTSVLNNYTFQYTLNQSRYNHNCRRRICVARDTWETQNGTRHELCCENHGIYYPPGKPTYKDDCIGYVCNNGNWLSTTYTDPACCRNPDWPDMNPTDWFKNYDYYEDWWVDYHFSSYWSYGGGGSPIKDWYRLNKTRTNYECTEVKCVARETWEPTGVVIQNCAGTLGCEFNGIQYNHTDRLPGCMKVYCVNGEWQQAGYIDTKCKKCYARWDPHLGTFDGTNYDYHGTCKYALVQDGTSYTPQYGVFSEFINCWGAACVGPSTYKDSSGTVIEMGLDGRYTPQLYTLYVNGVAYKIPDNIPRLVMEGTTPHPVMAWRYGRRCIRLLGSSKLAVQKCESSLDIWVSNDFSNTLYGLCGLYNGDLNDDFTKRDLSIASTATNFGDSWEVTGNCFTIAGRKKRDSVDESIVTVCDVDNTTKTAMNKNCKKMAKLVGGNVTEEELLVMMRDCMFDMCTVYTNTSGDATALDEFLRDIMASAAEIIETRNKTTDDDPKPASLLVNLPTDVTTEDSTEEPDIPAKLQCHDGKCNLHMKIQVRFDLT